MIAVFRTWLLKTSAQALLEGVHLEISNKYYSIPLCDVLHDLQSMQSFSNRSVSRNLEVVCHFHQPLTAEDSSFGNQVLPQLSGVLKFRSITNNDYYVWRDISLNISWYIADDRIDTHVPVSISISICYLLIVYCTCALVSHIHV